MTADEFLERSGCTMTPAASVLVGFAFQTVVKAMIEVLAPTCLKAVREAAAELVHEIIARTDSRAPSRDSATAHI